MSDLKSPVHSANKRASWLMPGVRLWLPLPLPLLLACAMLLAQTLGFMHGVVHGAAGSNVQVTLQSAGEACEPSANWVDKLFSSHQGDNDCRLFDQASHGSAAPQLAALALPVVLPSVAVAIFQGEALARWAAQFDARGPPLTR